MNKTILSEYKKMRRYGVSGYVGHDAETCLRLAKARNEYESRDDVEISYLPELESFEDIYGYLPPENTEFICVIVKVSNEIALSLGFVEANDKEYLRVAENELLAEAFS